MNHLDSRVYDLIDRIKAELLSIEGAEVITDFPISYPKYLVLMDAVIIKNKELIAVLEIIPYVKILVKSDVPISKNDDRLQYKYLIITNGEQIFLHDSYINELKIIDSVEDLIHSIFSILTPAEIDKKKEEIAHLLEAETRKFLVESIKMTKSKNWVDHTIKHFNYSNIFSNLNYDPNGQFFRLGDDIRKDENFENQLFNILLEDVPSNTLIYRYATLDTVFSTVNFNSVRMNGLAGMNDPSELDYADLYIDKNYSIFSNPNEVHAVNRRFITCCSELSDTLNQWRLYGEDCKGACMVFRIKNVIYQPGVKVKKISYGEKPYGRPFHLELELLKHLIETVRLVSHQSLQFKSLGIWKHFFKPFEYAEEKEVRILLVLNNQEHIKGTRQPIKKEWNLTATHKIISPYVNVPLNDPILPVQLDSITLGSKCPEKQLNKVQLEVMLEEKSIIDVKVTHSAINNYR